MWTYTEPFLVDYSEPAKRSDLSHVQKHTDGNMLSRREGTVTYTHTWDAENRLKTVSTTGHSVAYTYDADS
ncbi:MAG: hypothetical protein GX604_05080 [Actinobacteria bacterium]|nr:hypothetical protein [Actinomycetota bacterium]